MIRKLKVQNLILIDEIEVSFTEGLNIITGESGSGKSVLLTALSLLLGEKTKPHMIRKGMSKAIVEGVFQTSSKEVRKILEEEGIPQDSLLHIRREILETRSRIFLNDHKIDLATLQKMGKFLGEHIDQNAKHSFSEQKSLRKIIDSFGSHAPLTDYFSAAFTKHRDLDDKCRDLHYQKREGESRRIILTENLEEITRIDVKEGEEDELTKEHHFLANAKNLREKIEEAESFLCDQDAITERLRRAKTLLQENFEEPFELLKNAELEVEEAIHLLLQEKSKLEIDRSRLFAVEERLAEIESLKKKYCKEIAERKKEMEEELKKMQSFDLAIEETEKERDQCKAKTDAYAYELTKKRKKTSLELETKVLMVLEDLGLTKAFFQVEITPKRRTSAGDDELRFLFSANPGERTKNLFECASGGELSRFLLSMRASLAEKDDSSLLICDEIDANVGGETAALIGKKLQEIAKHRQVICITHFVQVAKCASSHFSVRKKEYGGRFLTSIEKLSERNKEEEYRRMTAS